jgi:histone H3/H4
MARRSSFSIKFDVAQVDRFADKLAGMTSEQIGTFVVDAINDTVDSAYALGRKTILSGINLTDDYVQRKMQVQHATPQKPKAEIVAFGGRGYLTSLSHYGAMQLTTDVNWSNDRIQAAGHKFGPWPGWTKRTGSAALGIPVNSKAAGRSVEVVKGGRKKIGPAFAIPGKTDADGNLLVFRRKKGSDKMETLTGPSVYQLFKVAAVRIEDQVAEDLQQAVIDAAESAFNKGLA